MHFNATVTGYFTLPHKLFTSTLPLGIYLGDFGSSLFFIVSGASLALTVPAEQNPAQFYKRRARAVYPLFWLAWFVVFSYRFVAHPGSFGGARTVTLVLTLLGLDNFAVAAGWVGTDFACVGEWFLGSILFLYLLFPLLQRGLRKRPWLTWALTLAVCIPVHLLGWDARLVAVHIPEFLFGMTFLTLAGRTRYILAPLLLAGAVLAQPWDGKITSALAGAGVFILLALAAPLLDRPWPRAVGAQLAKISYAVFLVHHVLIQELAAHFDLAVLSRRDTAFLFVVYLAATFAAAHALLWLQRTLRTGLADVFQVVFRIAHFAEGGDAVGRNLAHFTHKLSKVIGDKAVIVSEVFWTHLWNFPAGDIAMHSVKESTINQSIWERLNQVGCLQQIIHALVNIADEYHRGIRLDCFLTSCKGT